MPKRHTTANCSISPVRASRDGHSFHYIWAARIALRLVNDRTTLTAVAMEDFSPGSTAAIAGEEIADVVLYHGAPTLEDATRVEVIQLKYSPARTTRPLPLSEIAPTLAKFAKVYRDHKPADRAKLSFELVCNPLAEAHHDLVWQFFPDRIAHKGVTDDERCEDVPYELHTLPALAAQPARAVVIVRSWFSPDDPLFRFRGGRLIAIAFPAIGPELEAEALGIMEREGATVVEFVTAILANYDGEPATYPIVKALIDALPNDDERLQDLDSVLWSTGVLEGQFGFVEAYHTRRAAIAEWLTDPRPRVAAFARQFVAPLDNAIAAEQRQAERRGALRRLDHERPAA